MTAANTLIDAQGRKLFDDQGRVRLLRPDGTCPDCCAGISSCTEFDNHIDTLADVDVTLSGFTCDIYEPCIVANPSQPPITDVGTPDPTRGTWLSKATNPYTLDGTYQLATVSSTFQGTNLDTPFTYDSFINVKCEGTPYATDAITRNLINKLAVRFVCEHDDTIEARFTVDVWYDGITIADFNYAGTRPTSVLYTSAPLTLSSYVQGATTFTVDLSSFDWTVEGTVFKDGLGYFDTVSYRWRLGTVSVTI